MTTTKRLLLALALLAPLAAQATDLFAPVVTLSAVSITATTTTTLDVTKRTVRAVSTGTESAPTDPTVGISLDGVYAVRVGMVTSGNATAAKNVLAYVWSPAQDAWLRCPDWDLTSIASTAQAWAPVEAKVRVGRVTWVPNAVLTGTVTLTFAAQPVTPGTAAP